MPLIKLGYCSALLSEDLQTSYKYPLMFLTALQNRVTDFIVQMEEKRPMEIVDVLFSGTRMGA